MLEEGEVPKEIVGLLEKPLTKYFHNSVDCEYFRKELKLDLGFNSLLPSRKGLAIADKTSKKATPRKKATKKPKASAPDDDSDMSDEGKKKKKKKGKKPVKPKAARKRKKAAEGSDSDAEDEPAKKKKKK